MIIGIWRVGPYNCHEIVIMMQKNPLLLCAKYNFLYLSFDLWVKYDPDMFFTDFMRFSLPCDEVLHIPVLTYTENKVSVSERWASGYKNSTKQDCHWLSGWQVPVEKHRCIREVAMWHPSGPISVSHRVYFTSKGHAVKVPARIINYSWKYIPANGTYNYFNYWCCNWQRGSCLTSWDRLN